MNARELQEAIAMLTRIEARERRAVRCGARTRKGTPCQAQGRGRGGKCKYHGGMSTGPRTAEGKQRCREAALRRWEKVRAGKAAP